MREQVNQIITVLGSVLSRVEYYVHLLAGLDGIKRNKSQLSTGCKQYMSSYLLCMLYYWRTYLFVINRPAVLSLWKFEHVTIFWNNAAFY